MSNDTTTKWQANPKQLEATLARVRHCHHAAAAESLVPQYFADYIGDRDNEYLYRLMRLAKEAIPHPQFSVYGEQLLGYTGLRESLIAIEELTNQLKQDGLPPERVDGFSRQLQSIADDASRRIEADKERVKKAANRASVPGR